MALSLDRIGWHTDDGAFFTDDHGVTRNVMAFTPQAWKLLLKASVQRLYENSLGIETGYSDLP